MFNLQVFLKKNVQIQNEEETDTMNIYGQSPATDSPLQSPNSYLQLSSPSQPPQSPSLPLPNPSLPPPNPSLPPPNLSLLPQSETSSKKTKKMTEDDRLNKAFKILTATAALNFTSDESQDFGNFVAKKLRKYSLRTQGFIQNAIMRTFLNADNGLYEQGYNSCDFPINSSHSINQSSMSTYSEDSSQSCANTSTVSDTV